ncbi:AAC_collapsed_G0049890.mRNA.1.CDS.1 [Saccharomyces cerevisiae]|nr:AAC_collapsed_G0049890.mRNA.1.CDS.1 [Saccharomyces cerevisiae]
MQTSTSSRVRSEEVSLSNHSLPSVGRVSLAFCSWLQFLPSTPSYPHPHRFSANKIFFACHHWDKCRNSGSDFFFFQRRGISAREIPSRIASELIDVKLISLFFGWAGAIGCITNKLTNNSFKASALRFRSFLQGFLRTI